MIKIFKKHVSERINLEASIYLRNLRMENEGKSEEVIFRVKTQYL